MRYHPGQVWKLLVSLVQKFVATQNACPKDFAELKHGANRASP